ncbi:hypothetical protein X801_06022, partial [Opisthorchis viverrini]
VLKLQFSVAQLCISIIISIIIRISEILQLFCFPDTTCNHVPGFIHEYLHVTYSKSGLLFKCKTETVSACIMRAVFFDVPSEAQKMGLQECSAWQKFILCTQYLLRAALANGLAKRRTGIYADNSTQKFTTMELLESSADKAAKVVLVYYLNL